MIEKIHIVVGFLCFIIFCFFVYWMYTIFVKTSKEETKPIEYTKDYSLGKTEMPIMNNIYKG